MDEEHSANLQCICHDSNVTDPVVRPFDDLTWGTFLESVGVWKDLIGPRCDIAKGFVEEHGGFEDVPIPPNAGSHNRCYRYFTDSTKQSRGAKAKRKHDDEAASSAHGMFNPGISFQSCPILTCLIV